MKQQVGSKSKKSSQERKWPQRYQIWIYRGCWVWRVTPLSYLFIKKCSHSQGYSYAKLASSKIGNKDRRTGFNKGKLICRAASQIHWQTLYIYFNLARKNSRVLVSIELWQDLRFLNRSISVKIVKIFILARHQLTLWKQCDSVKGVACTDESTETRHKNLHLP